VLIATRHDSHASYVERALSAGKHVFVEKPLALDDEELARVEHAAAESDVVLMVGFNRRFAPLGRRLHEALAGHGAMALNYRVNAGRLPREHWTHDPALGGGRIIGEVCHFVDFAVFMAGAEPLLIHAQALDGASEPREDNVIALVRFGDGSLAAITYVALGDPALAKERIEVFGEAGAGTLDDFSELRLYRGSGERTASAKRDKGHGAEIEAFVSACRTGEQPWPVAEMAAVTRATFAIRKSLLVGSEVPA
jgi:predicted dehydrogenase